MKTVSKRLKLTCVVNVQSFHRWFWVRRHSVRQWLVESLFANQPVCFPKTTSLKNKKQEKPLHNKLVLMSSSSGVQMDTFSLLVFWKTSWHWLKIPVDFDCMWIGVLHCTCYNLVFWKTSCHWLKTPVDFDCMWIGVLHCTCYNLVTTVTTSKNLPNQGSQPIRCET